MSKKPLKLYQRTVKDVKIVKKIQQALKDHSLKQTGKVDTKNLLKNRNNIKKGN